jgi:prepilin-type N-terminal cleavage/methylation domain-containing protein
MALPTDMSRKGFTITEVLVVVMILSLVIMGAVSFFTYQSRYGADAAARRNARESASMVMGLIKSDLMHAGFAIDGQWELALYADRVDASPGDPYDRLFINYGRYYRLKPDPLAEELFIFNEFAKAYKTGTEINNEGGGYRLVSVANKNYLRSSDAGAVGAFISWDDTSDTLGMVDDVSCVEDPASGDFGLCRCGGGNTSCTVTASFLYAPAVEYRVDDGILFRSGDPILGTEPSIIVQGLGVRFQYVDNTGTVRWAPTDGEIGVGMNFGIRDLRNVEVSLTYRMRNPRRKESAKDTVVTRTDYVAPRSLVLGLAQGS